MKKVVLKKITRFEGSDPSPGFLLWKVSTQWRWHVETALAKIGLTYQQFILLAGLGWTTRNNADITQVKLARHCGTDITMTSQVLRSLERKGYVKRLQRKDDARSKFSQITERGALLVEQAIPLVESVDKQFFDGLGTDLQHYVEMMQTLRRKD